MGTTSRPPKWITPQLTRLVDEAPAGGGWPVPPFAHKPAAWVLRRHLEAGGPALCTRRPRDLGQVEVPQPRGVRGYAGRAGTGITDKELKRLAGVLAPLQVPKMPLAEPPPRDSRFGSPLKLSRVHWVRPEVVVEVTYLTWTEDNLLRQVSYQGQREDKPARQVVRPVPHPPRP